MADKKKKITKSEVQKAGSLKKVYYKRAEGAPEGGRAKAIAQRIGESELKRRKKEQEAEGGLFAERTKLISETFD